jgi:glycerophosphoryl diester phosphodiesterase
LPVEFVIAHHRLVSEQLMHDVHAAGRKLFAWTVNDPASMLRLASWGIDAIISDQTELMVQTFKPHNAATSRSDPTNA